MEAEEQGWKLDRYGCQPQTSTQSIIPHEKTAAASMLGGRGGAPEEPEAAAVAVARSSSGEV